MVPKRKSKSQAPQRKPLPQGNHVGIFKSLTGYYIGTAGAFGGMIVGRRLHKSYIPYPECATQGLNLETAKASMAQWEIFMERQAKK